MAQSIVARSDKAAGIVERHEAIPVDDRPGWWTVSDSVTGSGKTYLATRDWCACPDYAYRTNSCKHIQAVRQQEAELEEYARQWDAMVNEFRRRVAA